MPRVLVINGPNINLLGLREPAIYGSKTYAQLVAFIEGACAELSMECECFQSNHEGDIVDKIGGAFGRFDAIVINPAAYTHTSIAILDALKGVGLPAVEVHLSDPLQREEFRRLSYAGMACFAAVRGMGFEGYKKALILIKERLS